MKKHLLLFASLTVFMGAKAQMSPQLASQIEGSGHMTKCDVIINLHGQFLEDTSSDEQYPTGSRKEHHFRRREWHCSYSGVCYITPPTPDMPHKGDCYTRIGIDNNSWVSARGGVHYGLSAGSTLREQSQMSGLATSKTSQSASKDTFTYDVHMNIGYTNENLWSFSCGFEPGAFTRMQHREWKNVDPRGQIDQGFEDEHPTVHDGFSWVTMSTFKGENNPIHVIRRDGSFEIDVNLHGARQAGNVQMTCTANVTIRPTAGDYLAYIEPVGGMDAYKEWMPEGNLEDSLRKPGNHALFQVYVVKRTDTAKHLDGLIKRIVYDLKDVSHVPGVCMNYPAKHIDDKADLSFDNPLPGGTGRGNPYDNEIMELKFDGKATAQVNSFDFGGYGSIRATVTLTNGQELIAHSKTDERDFLTIPYRRDEESHVPDHWKEQNKASDMKDDEDKDKMSDGVGENYPGDGYSVYEEYRGFREKGKHIRTDPGKADLLVINKVSAPKRAQDGINLYMGVTGITVHSGFKEEEFGEDKEEPGLNDSLDLYMTGFHFSRNKIMNFNHDKVDHTTDQHGLILTSSPLQLGYAEAVPKQARTPGTPKKMYFLVICSDFDPGAQGWSNLKGNLNTANTPGHDVTADPGSKARIITDEYAATVAHEMLHCSSVQHHGDYKDEGSYSCRPGDRVQPAEDSTAVYSIEGHKKLVLYWDDTGELITGQDPVFKQVDALKVTIDGQKGSESGFEDCIMRYDYGNAYRYTDGKIYVVRQEPGYLAELTGIQLCDSGKGTGVNDPKHSPRPRYGNASTDGCKQQVCINDKYAQ